MALKLRYRNSFIDADDVDLGASEPKRASSLPPKSQYVPLVEEQALEEENGVQSYVDNLSQQMQTRIPMNLRSPSYSNISTDLGTPGSSSEAASTPFHLEEEKTKDVEAMATPGSVGHPEICRRQCIYFLAGHCSNGDACTYCHLPHPQKPPKLDKRQRTIMQALNYQELIALILRVGRAKIEELGILVEAKDLLEILLAEAGNTPPPSMADRENRALSKTLSRMSLSGLLGLVTHRKAHNTLEEDGASRIAMALEQMRAARQTST